MTRAHSGRVSARPHSGRVTARPRVAVLLALVLSALALLAPAATSGAEPPTFEPGTLTSDFPGPVSWRFTFESVAQPLRVELVTRLPGSDQVYVSPPGQGEITQRPDGSWLVTGSNTGPVPPNTLYRMRLRVTTDDGSFLGPEASVLVADERFDWQVRESDRLRLHWYEGGASFATRALRVGEEGVTKAEEFLGVRLDSKVDIFVYADADAFRDAIGPRSPENAAGVPFASIATFFALIRPEQIESLWVGDVVPHELAHLVLESAVGPGVAVPLWLNEGLATYLGSGETAAYRRMVRDAVDDGTLVPLDGLTGNFPTNDGGERSIAAYAEAVSAVDFMVREYGEERIARLVEAFSSQGADDAFTAALGVDTAEFGAAWLRSVDAPAPEAFGPQPAPAGPLPPDWLGPPPVAGQLPPEPTPIATPLPAAPPAAPEGGIDIALVLLLGTGLLAAVALAAAVARARGRTT